MNNWEIFTAPGTPKPVASLCEIIITSETGETFRGHADYSWQVLAKLRNAIDRGYTTFQIRPLTKESARHLDPQVFE